MTKSTVPTDQTIDLVDRSVLDETMLAEPAPPHSDIATAKSSRAASWRMGLVLGSGPSMSEESHRRLQERLRLASLLIGSGFAAYFILKLLNVFQSTSEPRPIVFWTHFAVTVAELAVGWRLCVNCKMALKRIRIVEAIVFGGPAIFFVMINYQNLTNSLAAGYMADISPPWLLLLFTYALFIPNTWQRAAAVIVPMAMIPLGITLAARLTSATFAQILATDPDFQYILIRLFLTMIWAATIAIWGVRSIRSLRREAFEARKMGQYKLIKLLGKGGMGEVYLAEHRMLKRPCAIKLIRPEMAQSAQNLARFEREVQATARLTHWNTVEIYDYGNSEDGAFYYVMEYLPGMNLDDIGKGNGPLPDGRVIHLLTQVCDALAEAHCQGFIHRDLKPANIFAARRGGLHDVAKLLDFGLVRQTGLASGTAEREGDGPGDGLTRDGSITGSPLYLSPEQAMGDPPDRRSDIYSLGAVAYYLTTGQPPFVDSNPMRVIMAHARDIPTNPMVLNPDLSPQLAQVIMTCLEKKPENRLDNVHLLKRALQACVGERIWTNDDSAAWWKDHGCPHKKQQDSEVLELAPV